MSRVLITSRSFGAISEVGRKMLVEAGFDVRGISPEERPLTEEKLIQILRRENPEIVVCGADPMSQRVMQASPHLILIMKHGVGVDNIDFLAANHLNILVANAPGTNTESVADFTMAVMLSLLRRVFHAVHSTKSGGWERFIGHDLGALTVGVIGTGRIGRGVIHRLQGFGSQILAYDIVQNEGLTALPNLQYVSLDELLKLSDIVTLHVPLVAETNKMIGRRELGLMKRTAFLVNQARGELVDEAALCDALEQNLIAGAAVDVYEVEPPQSSQLIRFDNVLPTPHIAAYTYESMERMDCMCAQTIIDTLRAKTCLNILNPEVLREHQ
jgi:D-3-phosphoglycerate dehydrogenase